MSNERLVAHLASGRDEWQEGTMDDDQQFCLRWNNHQSTLVSVFDTLLEKGMHVDCTLAAEGQTLKAHKVVLSACSPYFESVLSQQYDKHPIIILKDVKYAELRAMMDYMYRGEVNISQDQLAALLKAAESLQIKGLSDNKPSRPPSRPAQAVAAHPPRVPSPPPQVRDGSIDSREGSVSPTRRRKKARRMSSEGPPGALMGGGGGVGGGALPAGAAPPADAAAGNGDAPPCKEEMARDGVEDLTLDEDHDEHPPPTHNDVVRNFQWHLERSQDEIMNSSDSARDSQGKKTTPRHSIMTRSKKVTEETGNTTTLAILKNVTPLKETPLKEAKENKKEMPKPVVSPAAPAPPPPADEVKEPPEVKQEEKFNIFGRGPERGASTAVKSEKGYKCRNCQRSYNARRNLVRHETLECGREPQYKCPFCSCSKHRRNELKKHILRTHPEHGPGAAQGQPALAHAQTQSLASLVPPCIQVTNIMKPNATKEVAPFPSPLHLSKLPMDTLGAIPENIKAHLLQQAFMQNNNTVGQAMEYKLQQGKQEEQESDVEYDDTDDIVLPEEADAFYDGYGGLGGGHSNDAYDAKMEGKYMKRDGNSSDDASRQFECRHCGKKYRWKSTLRRHENVECGGKAPSHQCPYCSYKAKQRGNLGVHIRKHHNNEWYIYASNKVRRNKKTSI
ncbi:hypothetical protein K1T71_006370 [Dendrolimus kikuchii]|uniref:Uncharacterized protein n=1 Tax=Dendrolimus kikuchii TaxID=765133 RepID=A0ACC1D3W2_9NEOP|nr:hypothetical protein K1T71_006370 [Dendrolimus kikuchii]